MRSFRWSFFALALQSACLIVLSKPLWCQTDTRPILVLREDDIRTTWRTPFPEFGGLSALEYGKLKRIPITWGIITSLADSATYALTWAEIKDYLDTAGGEAASHSVVHAAMPNTQAYINELANSKAAIDAHLGPAYTCTTFLQPGAWTGDANCDSFAKLENPIGQAIQANYAQSMAYLGAAWRVGDSVYRYGSTNLCSVDYSPTQGWLDVQALLDVAANTPGLILVISCHGLQASSGTTSYNTRADVMRQLMDTLADLRDQGLVRLMSLHDAFHTVWPLGLNRVPNPGFEIRTNGYSDPCVPWYLGNATILDGEGVDGTRCVRVAGSGARARSGFMMLAPGRYEISWWQKCEPGYPVQSSLQLWGSSLGASWAPGTYWANYAKYRNYNPQVWESKSALLRIKERMLLGAATFSPDMVYGQMGGYRIDNVALVSKPVDPAESPSLVSIVPSPMGGTITWDTPPTSDVLVINCRYDMRTHPMESNEGTSLGSIGAIPGTRQQLSFSLNWSNPSLYAAYISVFGVKAAGCSDPDVDYIVADRSPPSATASISPYPTGNALGTWSISEDQSSVYEVRYAVGRSPGASDVVEWTASQDKDVTLTNLPLNAQLYFSVKAQNSFGFWSPPSSVQFRCLSPISISTARACADGTTVTISGYVTAVFGDGCYVEASDRASAIKLIGSVPANEGDFLTATGVLSTTAGERAVIADH